MPSADPTSARVARIRRRERRGAPAAAITVRQPPRALLAAAIGVTAKLSYGSKIKPGATAWQDEAWAHYDTCPELHAAGQIVANACARAQLIAVDVDPDTGVPSTAPTDDREAGGAIADLFGGPTGQSQAQAAIGLHMTIAGECYAVALVDENDIAGATAAWEILSVSAVHGTAGDTIVIDRPDGSQRTLRDGDLLIRIWRPHPRRYWEADSPVRALLPVLRELAQLTAQVTAVTKSRLAGAGILWLSDQIEPPPTADEDGQDEDTGTGTAQSWSEYLTAAMVEPIRDPDSAAAVVPIIAQVSQDAIEHGIRHDQFRQDLDTSIQPLREANIRRLGLGLDMPPEMLLGLGDVNHWGQWQITEAFVKSSPGAIFELVCDALTTGYLRPALSPERAALFAVGVDLTDLLPDQTDDAAAKELYDAGLLSEDEYMASRNFDPKRQKADPDERLFRLALDLLRLNPTAEMASALGPLLLGRGGSRGLLEALPSGGPGSTPTGTTTDTVGQPGSDGNAPDAAPSTPDRPAAPPPEPGP